MPVMEHLKTGARRRGRAAGLLGALLAALLTACALPAPAPPPPAAPRTGVVAVPPAPAAAVPAAVPAAVAAAAPPAAPASVPPPPPAPPPILSFDDAVLSAANNLLGKAQLPETGGPRFSVVIDPLIDGMTGAQSKATQDMGRRIVDLIHERYPQYEVQPFNIGNVSKSPLVLIGTFTGVNAERKTEGTREAYRILSLIHI